MNESYAEAGVKRKKSATTLMIQIAAVFGILMVFFVGVLFLGSIATFIGSVLVVLCVFFFPRMNSIEYEYVFCDGQLDFDKIMGNSKRRTALRIDFDKVEIMAPVKSHSLDSFNHIQQLKVKDFSSQNPDAKVYAIIVRKDNEVNKVLFEPNEKMIACIKQKAPRKVIEV